MLSSEHHSAGRSRGSGRYGWDGKHSVFRRANLVETRRRPGIPGMSTGKARRETGRAASASDASDYHRAARGGGASQEKGACGRTPDPQFARRHPPSSTSRGQPCRHLLPSSGDALARTNGGLTAFTLCPSFRQIPVVFDRQCAS
jgi:hypothetical protein